MQRTAIRLLEQKDDSLEEFRKTHTQQEVSALTVKDHQPVYKDMRRFMPGGVFLFNGKVHTLQRSHGRYKGMPFYYIDTDGEQEPCERMYILTTKLWIALGLTFRQPHPIPHEMSNTPFF